MRSCRHCAHENADHLAFCSQCGRKLARTDGALPVLRRLGAGDAAAYSRTVMATPGPVSTTARTSVSGSRSLSGLHGGFAAEPEAPARPRSRVRWLGESV